MASNLHTFNGKVVIITGVSSGIGKACAFEFADNGATVVLAARRENELKKVETEIKIRGGEAYAVKTDVKNIDACKNLIDKTVEKYGKIDVLINNAGVSMRATFEELNLSVIKELMDTNFYGAVYCTKFALPFLLEQKGTLIGISSISGLTPLPGRTGYCASKYAMEGFFSTLRLENIKKGLNVLVVRPGFTSSNIRKAAFNKLGVPQNETPRDESKMMSSKEVAEIILKAAVNRKRNLTLTLHGKLTVWLHKIFSGITDRIILYEMAKEPNSPF
ncbi:MAG TPA: SDR family oxidoreductase [Flavobacterium sp.]|jgi:NADP-dependent 3-hydroxy acid dehydrogenase YdfG|nr:SDR family oxidoreductase [Flavobacterium sp.]HRZ74219.1 SDR family oxidoreductase [Flavobacterium sp.]